MHIVSQDIVYSISGKVTWISERYHYLYSTFIQRSCSVSNSPSTSQQRLNTWMMLELLKLAKWTDVRVGVV